MRKMIANQLLVRIQKEMQTNIKGVENELSEWLERPESGGVETTIAKMAEVEGGLYLLGDKKAAQLSKTIQTSLHALQEGLNSTFTAPQFQHIGYEIAKAVIVLADYVNTLSQGDSQHQNIAERSTYLADLLTHPDAPSFQETPWIAYQTAETIAAHLRSILTQCEINVEYLTNKPDTNLQVKLLADAQGVLAYAQLLQWNSLTMLITEMMAEVKNAGNYDDWFRVAQLLLLSQSALHRDAQGKTLTNLDEVVALTTHTFRRAANADLLHKICTMGSHEFADDRKHFSAQNSQSDWQTWGLQTYRYSATFALLGLPEYAQYFAAMAPACIKAETTAIDTPRRQNIITLLTAIEYWFQMIENGNFDDRHDQFLQQTINEFTQLFPASDAENEVLAGLVKNGVVAKSTEVLEDDSLAGALEGIDSLDDFQFSLEDALPTAQSSGAANAGASFSNGFATNGTSTAAQTSTSSAAPTSTSSAAPNFAPAASDFASTTSGSANAVSSATNAVPGSSPVASGSTNAETGSVNVAPSSASAAPATAANTSSSASVSDALSSSQTAAASHGALPALHNLDDILNDARFAQSNILSRAADFAKAYSENSFFNDPDIRQVFIEELQDKVHEIAENMPGFTHASAEDEVVGVVRRAFHTIKGSGRTTGFIILGEFAWQHEQLLNYVLDKQYSMNALVVQIVSDALSLLQKQLQEDPFEELKKPLLTQAYVAEKASAYLLQHPQANPNEIEAFWQQLSADNFLLPRAEETATSEEKTPESGEAIAVSEEAPSSEEVETSAVETERTSETEAPPALSASSDFSALEEPVAAPMENASASGLSLSLASDDDTSATPEVAEEPAEALDIPLDFALDDASSAQEVENAAPTTSNAASTLDFALDDNASAESQSAAATEESLAIPAASPDSDKVPELSTAAAATNAESKISAEPLASTSATENAVAKAVPSIYTRAASMLSKALDDGALDAEEEALLAGNIGQVFAAAQTDFDAATMHEALAQAAMPANVSATAENIVQKMAQSAADNRGVAKLAHVVKQMLAGGETDAEDADVLSTMSQQVLAATGLTADSLKARLQESFADNQAAQTLLKAAFPDSAKADVATLASHDDAVKTTPTSVSEDALPPFEHSETHALSSGHDIAESAQEVLPLSESTTAQAPETGAQVTPVIDASVAQNLETPAVLDEVADVASTSAEDEKEKPADSAEREEMAAAPAEDNLQPLSESTENAPIADVDNSQAVQAETPEFSENAAASAAHLVAANALNQQLDAIAQHPSLHDAVQSPAADSIPENFLKAVGNFNHTLAQAEEKATQESIDDSLEAVYQIEDTIQPGDVPPWVWRVLDAIEQLLQSHRVNGVALSDKIGPLLHQAIKLIEHHKETRARDGAGQIINAMITAKKQVRGLHLPAAHLPQLAYPVISEVSESPDAAEDVAQSDSLIHDVFTLLENFQRSPQSTNILQAVLTHFTTLSNLPFAIKNQSIQTVIERGTELIQAFLSQRLSSTLENITTLNQLCHELKHMCAALAAGKTPAQDEALLAKTAQLLAQSAAPEPAPVAKEQPKSIVNDAIDPALLDIFRDEADTLVAHFYALLKEDIHNGMVVDDLKRTLHTLKGGARLVGLENMGNTTHFMEGVVEQLPDYSEDHLKTARDLLLRGHEVLQTMLDSVARNQAPDAASDFDHALQVFASSNGEQLIPEKQPVPKAPESTVTPAQAEPKTGELLEKADAPHFVRVEAHLLESLIEMVGEIAILRSRIENLSAAAGFNIEELNRITDRIDEQMRRLDSEAQAQMLFKKEKLDDTDEEFDPLELDRFTEVQQLSRQLSESIDDLKNVQSSLDDENDIIRHLIGQQSSLQRNLQDSLMSTQLVRFDVNEARLQRLVQQTAKAVDKKVTLLIEGGNVEFDRHLLEAFLPAIEHMLRNAIDHGIESAEERKALGKPEAGLIRIALHADVANIAIDISDDGHGFNYQEIREKAISRGLLAADAAVDEQYLNQFVLESGFSTSQNVTQVSGRGVGMDVVSEIVKQHHGQLTMRSKVNQGATFSIVFPFSMSLLEVLEVQIAGQGYAVALNTIASIAPVPTQKIRQALAEEEIEVTSQGETYQLCVLGKLFASDYQFTPFDLENSPVLFIKSGQARLALYVDHIDRRTEIVVKNINQQIMHIPGMAGATILGDGEVIPVLDLYDLSRQLPELRRHMYRATPRRRPAEKQKILVVDDSITMQKISTRLLEKHGYAVRTAKDGLDAIDVMRDYTPDLIMLDIEMPRMDGFEFAEYIRSNAQYDNLPIVMITSRTGDKHRNRAEKIGVQGYLGKPYQEDQLLHTLHELLGENAHV